MQYSLYDLYKNCSLDLYDIRKHFLDKFYYQDHSRNKARDVMRIVVSSSKIAKLLKTSITRNIVPNYIDFLSVICSMWRFMFRSNDTQILASICAALRWDIEVNSKQNLFTQEELKSEVIKVFKKYNVYKEMTEEEFKSVSSYRDFNVTSDSKKNNRHSSNTWSLIAFIKEYGPRMQVGEFTNHETDEIFKSCVFTQEDGTKTFVAFSSKLGVLTEREIADMKEDLAVIKSKAGHYSLIKGRRKAWKDVDV